MLLVSNERILIDCLFFSNNLLMQQLDNVIDLVIPRGSNKLVSQIKESTKIPVLGHSGERLRQQYQCHIIYQ